MPTAGEITIGASFYDILGLPAPTLLPAGGGPFLSAQSSTAPQLTSQAVKKAYHRALLRWHPDKSALSSSNLAAKSPSPTPSTPSPTPSSWRNSGGSRSPNSPESPRSHPGEKRQQQSQQRKQSKSQPPSQQQQQQQNGFTLDQILTAYTVLSTDRGRRTYEREYRLQLLLQSTSQQQLNAPTENVDLSEFVYHETWGRHTRSCRCGEQEGFVVLDTELAESVGADGKGEVVVGCAGCSLWVRVGFGVMADDDESGSEYEEDDEQQRFEMENLGTVGPAGGRSGTSAVGVPGIGRGDWNEYGLGEAR